MSLLSIKLTKPSEDSIPSDNISHHDYPTEKPLYIAEHFWNILECKVVPGCWLGMYGLTVAYLELRAFYIPHSPGGIQYKRRSMVEDSLLFHESLFYYCSSPALDNEWGIQNKDYVFVSFSISFCCWIAQDSWRWSCSRCSFSHGETGFERRIPYTLA